MSVKQSVADNLKNITGWRTPRKLVAFAVDDYCNVRVASRAALNNLKGAGLELSGRFDGLDTMETRQDLEALFETLGSVRDAQGHAAVFTAYALSANPDFERIRACGASYQYEPVTITFQRLAAEQPAAYEGAWKLWQEGMEKGLIRPQFHGREHFNIRLFEEKLQRKTSDLLANLANRSLAGLTREPSFPDIGFSQAFAVHDDSCLGRQIEVLKDGMQLFEQCFGIKSITFTPPAQTLSPRLYPVCEKLGIRLIHKPRLVRRKAASSEYVYELSWTGRKSPVGHVSLVRNVVFEPGLEDARASEERVLQQIAAAFRWQKPAVISSHRVNFCGLIDEKNRSLSLQKLRRVLERIVSRWPDVEFVAVDDLAALMNPISQSELRTAANSACQA